MCRCRRPGRRLQHRRRRGGDDVAGDQHPRVARRHAAPGRPPSAAARRRATYVRRRLPGPPGPRLVTDRVPQRRVGRRARLGALAGPAPRGVRVTRLAVVMSGFPRTSETFAVGELVAMARTGMLARLYATKAGDGAAPQPGAEELLPFLHLLPAGDAAHQAAALVTDLRDVGADGVHGYFAHRPAEVAALAAPALGVGFSFSVHALDARKVPARELADRARAAVGVVACNADVAQYVEVPGARVRLLSH